MVKSKTYRKIKVDFTLNEEEAKFLRSFLQNPLPGHEETPKETKIRKEIHDTLQKGLEG